MQELTFKGFTLKQQEEVNGNTVITIQQGDTTITLTPEEIGMITREFQRCYKMIINNGIVKAIRMQ